MGNGASVGMVNIPQHNEQKARLMAQTGAHADQVEYLMMRFNLLRSHDTLSPEDIASNRPLGKDPYCQRLHEKMLQPGNFGASVGDFVAMASNFSRLSPVEEKFRIIFDILDEDGDHKLGLNDLALLFRIETNKKNEKSPMDAMAQAKEFLSLFQERYNVQEITFPHFVDLVLSLDKMLEGRLNVEFPTENW